jgi:hypothetical protein
MNKISSIIRSRETNFFKFIPDKAFYEKTGIGRKRWGMIVRGEKSPTIEETKKLAEIFELTISELID